MTTTPPVRHRIVGSALRLYRRDLGCSLEDAARILECHCSKISRIETGQRGIRNRELRELLDEYGVAKEEQETLAMIANPRGIYGWWKPHSHALPDIYVDLISLEMAAQQIMLYDAQQIPDLLQIKEYTNGLADVYADLIPHSLRQILADVFPTRQDIILGELRPEIAIVIGENALQRMPGGQAVARAQLAALASVNNSFPRVRMQVLLSEEETHFARSAGSFIVMRHAQIPSLQAVYLRGAANGIFIEDHREITAYVSGFRQLVASALTPEASATLIRQMQYRNTREHEQG